MLARRGVPIPARRLDLEPVASASSADLSGSVLDHYARNEETASAEPVPILRDLPFGDAFAPPVGETPFYLDDTAPIPIEVDDSDTDGIPIGLPDLLTFADVDVPSPPVVPAAAAQAPAPSSPVEDRPPVFPIVPVIGAFVAGLVVGVVGMLIVG
jgi:hypothetical protein